MANTTQRQSKLPGIFGAYANAAKTRQRNLNRALGDDLNPRKLGTKPKRQRQGGQ